MTPKYFIMLYPNWKTYKLYGTRNYNEPATDDPRCVWRGNDYAEAREKCKELNAKRKEDYQLQMKEMEVRK